MTSPPHYYLTLSKMTIQRLSPDCYSSLFDHQASTFGRVSFNELNSTKVDEVAYLAALTSETDQAGTRDEGLPRALGIIAGLKNGRWRAPFSAPFGEISATYLPSAQELSLFFDSLKEFAGNRHFEITLPPRFYNPDMMALIEDAALTNAEKITRDINYHYDLSDFPRFDENLSRAARKNFHRAQKAGFAFAKTDDIERAYSVIKANRDSHGYYLAMSLEQVKETVRLVEADFFLLTLDGADVAAAMAYHVAPGIVQFIYWGDAPGYSFLRPMNILPYHLFEYYSRRGLRIADIGPASTDGIPNEGLCRFKESIGCRLTPKITFIL